MTDSTADLLPKKPTLIIALAPILFLITLLSINVYIFKDDALSGSNQMVLLAAAAVAAAFGYGLGHRWPAILKGMVNSIKIALPAILILLLVGALTGTWLLSGIIPTLIYYGLEILNPSIFLAASAVICAIVSVATGSSWTTAATIGIALMGIGQAMGLPAPMIGGAILSGAYFGDKLSPLSDTTNLAAATANTDLFTHIRYMTFTTVPSFLIALLLFTILGFTQVTQSDANDISLMQEAVAEKFNISLWLFIVPVLVVTMIVKHVPAIPAMFAGALLGGIFALIFQPEIVAGISGDSSLNARSAYIGVMTALYGAISIATGNAAIDELLSAGGMAGMLNTVWLILAAMIFGGVMEACGFLKRIIDAIMSFVHSTVSLVTSTVFTCGFINITASEQYLAIAIPGRMFDRAYKEKGLAPQNLSRSLEDAGTVTSVLVPWNTCGAFHANVLNVATIAYLPFCFFNIISPFMTILFAYFNIKIAKLPSEAEESTENATT